MRLIARVTCLFLLALLAACGAHFDALHAPPVALKGGGGPKSVVVISAIGDTLQLKKVGITVFGNDFQEVPIEAWGIDDQVGARIAREMGQNAKVKVVKAPRGTFDPMAKAGPFADRNELFNGIVRGLTAQHPSDLIVIVYKAGSQLANSNQTVNGIGLLQTSGLFSKTWMHALFGVQVMDGKTLAPVSIKVAQNPDHKPLISPFRGPHHEIDAARWPDPTKAVADQRLKSEIQAMVDKALAATLAQAVAMN